MPWPALPEVVVFFFAAGDGNHSGRRREPIMKKVSVIGGGGNVGASAGLYLAERGVCDVLLVDIAEGIPRGNGLGLSM